MAIYQSASWVLPIVGDGVSTTVDIDMYDYINELQVLPKTPATVLSVSVNSPGPAVTATVNGSVVSLTFASPLSFASWSLSLQLGF